MYIRCWGSRGSVPVSGKEYEKYGGDTTCIEIRSRKDDIIIIDAGTGIRRLGNKLLAEKRFDYHLIFTHAHLDHIMGFPFFKPFYAKHSEFRMYRCPDSRFVKTMLSNIMDPPFFPVRFTEAMSKIIYMDGIDCKGHFRIGSIQIEAIPISHPNTGRGYKFTEDGRSFVFITDNELGFGHPGGLGFDDYVSFSSGADLLIHDAEYTPEEYQKLRTWGHSSYTDVLELAMKADVKKVGLFHINQDRTDVQVDQMVENCRKIIAEKNSSLECLAVSCTSEFDL
ncbi:MAG: MBL fold metallo-hydrolase [Desulfococcaceae bacterium]